MCFRMFGYGGDMASAVGLLRACRVETVTAAYSETAAAVARENGLEFFVCERAMEAHTPEELCESAAGEVLQAPCPNSPSMAERVARRLSEMARRPCVSGLTLDFARYPSPAFAVGCRAVTTCFCRHCLERMRKEGLDAEAIRRAVLRWPAWRISDLPLWRAFFNFRTRSVSRYITTVCESVRQEAPGKPLGAYVFSPCLAPLVGQSYAAFGACFDFLSPMIYRYFPSAQGEACLDHELGALRRVRDRLPLAEAESFSKVLCALTGIEELPPAALLRAEGLPPKKLQREFYEARRQTENTCLIPIVLLDDARLLEVTNAAELFGVDGLDFFWFDRRLLETTDVLL